MDVTWEPPGPGPWLQDRAHTPVAQSLMMQNAYPEPFRRGFEEAFAKYGALVDRLVMKTVNGFIYHQVQPFDMPGPDGPPTPETLGAEIGRRAGVAGAALEGRIWRDDMSLWEEECKPGAIARHRELYDRDISALDDDELREHLADASRHLDAMVFQHHRFNASALLPVARFALSAAEWSGRPPTEMFGVLDGYSPVSSVRSPELGPVVEALGSDADARDLVTGSGDPVRRLTELRTRVPAVDEYIRSVGFRVVDGFDVVNPTIGERPEMILDRIGAAMSADHGAARARSDAFAASVRADVPDARHAEFDELLDDARALYRLRDERGIYSDVSAIGLMRLAMLEAGRRGAAAGRLSDPDLILDATIDEVLDFVGGSGPSEAELRERRTRRTSFDIDDVPRLLGPPPPEPPPLDGLPGPLAEVMGGVGFAIEGVLGELEAPVGDDTTLGGIAASGGVYEGKAHIIESVDDLFAIEEGDVIVAATTGEAFNSFLHMVGALVTDHGSYACHAGIVAREAGCPAVVGTVNATARINEGARVRVDGETGQVVVLS